MKRKSIYIIFITLLLVLPLCLCACKKDVQETESGTSALQTYRLPTEWTVTEGYETRSYTVAYDGSTAELTRDGKLLLRVTLDEAGNVVRREEAGGAVLDAVYDADGHLTETLLRDADGRLRQRTEYDRDGRAVRQYTRGWVDEVSLREYTYGEDGELLTEVRSYDCRTILYEYHENGVLAAETGYLMGTLRYDRREYDENGVLTWGYTYGEDGTVSFRYEYDAEGNVVSRYDGEGNLYENYREEKTYDGDGNLTEYRYLRDDGVSWRNTYVYDADGNCVEERRYDGESALTQESFHTYDEAGVRTKTVDHSYLPESGELIGSAEIDYDVAGNATQHINYDGSGNLTYRLVREYRSIAGEWRVVSSLSYDGEGALQSRQELAYDEKGNNTADWAYDGEGELSTRGVLTFDEQDRLTEHVRYDADGNVLYRMEQRYDEQGNLRELTSYATNGSIDTHHVYDYAYVYDDAGRLASQTAFTPDRRLTYSYKTGSGLRTETCTDGDGNVVHVYETVYDGKGDPRIEQYNDDGYETRNEYEWDADGGLLSRVRYSGDKTVLFRLETSGHVECQSTEAQYRRLLELLFAATEYPRDTYQFTTEDVG